MRIASLSCVIEMFCSAWKHTAIRNRRSFIFAVVKSHGTMNIIARCRTKPTVSRIRSRAAVIARTCHSVLCFQSDRPSGSRSWMDTSVPSLLKIRELLALWLLLLLSPAALAAYSIGVGIADSTGPTAEIVFVSIVWWNRIENHNVKLCIKKLISRMNEKVYLLCNEACVMYWKIIL